MEEWDNASNIVYCAHPTDPSSCPIIQVSPKDEIEKVDLPDKFVCVCRLGCVPISILILRK